MRGLLAILFIVALSGVSAFANPRWVEFPVKWGTTSTNILTATQTPIGYVDEVYVLVPSAAFTGVVSIVSTPNVSSSLTPTIIYTNAECKATGKARPRVTQTDNTGGALSSLTVAERFLCVGDPVVLRVEQVSALTGVTFRAWIKIESK